MKRTHTPHDDSWENDAVWSLLDQAPPAAPSSRFVDDTVRAARLQGIALPWWKCLGPQASIPGLVAAAAMIVIGFILIIAKPSPYAPTAAESPQAQEIQEIAETETLIAAIDHMDQFSDTELVSLIGF